MHCKDLAPDFGFLRCGKYKKLQRLVKGIPGRLAPQPSAR
jgi:hypothetical protein